MPYVKPLISDDLAAMNELAELTWSWEVRFWTERGLENGSFIINAVNPKDNTWYRSDGTTVSEAIQNFFKKINYEDQSLPIPDYP